MAVRVVFADDNYLVREGVAGLLTETARVDLVEVVADPDALHRAVALSAATTGWRIGGRGSASSRRYRPESARLVQSPATWVVPTDNTFR